MVNLLEVKIREIFKIKNESSIKINGWIKETKILNNIANILLEDGSCNHSILIQYNLEKYCNFENIETQLSKGTSIQIEGLTQFYDKITPIVKADKLKILGNYCQYYPLNETNSLNFLRTIPYLRGRTKTFSAIFRIKSSLINIISQMLNEKRFTYFIPNKIESSQDDLERIVLTDSMVISLQEVYHKYKINNKLFIAIDMLFSDSEKTKITALNFLKTAINSCFNKNEDDINFLHKTMDSSFFQTYSDIAKKNIKEIPFTYIEKIIEQNQINDFNDTCNNENYSFLEKIFNKITIINDWPEDKAPFYTRKKDNNLKEMSKIFSKYGEIIMEYGQKEERYLFIDENAIKNNNEKLKKWYTEIKKYSSAPHGYIIFHIDELCKIITGIKNDEDIEYFHPRLFKD